VGDRDPTGDDGGRQDRPRPRAEGRRAGGAEPAGQHPWLRIQLLLRSMLGTRWDATTWPTVKAEMKKALEMRSRIQRARSSCAVYLTRRV
jgi:hypothetical protein